MLTGSEKEASMAKILIGTMLVLMGSMAAAQEDGSREQEQEQVQVEVLEAYPEEIQASLETQARHLRQLIPPDPDGESLDFVLENLRRWNPGQVIRVAFFGGDSTLRRDIADVASEWSQFGNIRFDFGASPAAGSFHEWSPADRVYRAEIRISFHERGFWSIVGNDSITPAVSQPGEPSMNLGGFHIQRPADWKAVVRHEFGHALGFHHEHQHPEGGCDDEFRWDDDLGYLPTRDGNGQFMVDPLGRRPGLYTLLSGPPNRWPPAKVDYNLRQLRDSRAFSFESFDRESIMKYFFGSWMFKSPQNSHCFTPSNAELSAGDKRGVALAYPRGREQIERLIQTRDRILGQLVGRSAANPQMMRLFQDRLEDLERFRG